MNQDAALARSRRSDWNWIDRAPRPEHLCIAPFRAEGEQEHARE